MSNYNHYWSDIDSEFQRSKFKPMWQMMPRDINSIADVGGGIGGFFDVVDIKNFDRKKFHVIDSSETAIQKVIENDLSGTIHNIDSAPLPIDDNSYDLVLLSDVLEHMNNPWAVLKEATRISNKYVFVHGPNFAALKCRLDALRGLPIRQVVTNPNGSLVDSRGRKANHIYYITYKNLIFWADRAGLTPYKVSVFNRKKHKPFKFLLERFCRNMGEQYNVLFVKDHDAVSDDNFLFY